MTRPTRAALTPSYFAVEPKVSPTCFGLADCNNFYAAAEVVFRPALDGKPVLILSNNDGCVIARSQAAKRLGIKMGAPVHTLTKLIKEHNIVINSANFALYADLSSRVMSVLSESVPNFEVYSIDEAFLDLSSVPALDRPHLASDVRSRVKRWTGLPISIGIAPTKTLSKIANDQAKTLPTGVHTLQDQATDGLLRTLSVEDIWGIGPQRGDLLRKNHITTAWHFKYASHTWVRHHLYLPGARTQLELRGISCLPFDEAPDAKQQIMCSRAFGRPISTLSSMKEAIASYATRVCEKVRAQHSLASVLTLFLTTNSFQETQPQYHKSATLTLPRPTAYTPEIISAAHRALERIYRDGFLYHKAGVMLGGFTSATYQQQELLPPPAYAHQIAIMQVMDRINHRFGRDTIWLGATGNHADQSWAMRQQHLSAHYTSRWAEIAHAH